MKVSVIIPVYNVEQYLNQCVDSILNQTYSDLEILLIDDGSADGSGAICDHYAKKDARVAVVHQANGGVSAARNTGLERASGLYIVFVDSDDWLHSRAIETMLSIEEQTHADLVICNYAHVTRRGESSTAIHDAVYDSGEIGHNLLRLCVENGRTVCNKLFRADLIQMHHLRFLFGVPVGEDAIFSATYMGLCEKIVTCSDITYYYNKLVADSAMSKIRPEYYVYQENIFQAYQEAAKRKLTGSPQKTVISTLAAFFCAESIHYHLFFAGAKCLQKKRISEIAAYYRPYLDPAQPIYGDKIIREEFQLLLAGETGRFIRQWKRRQKKKNIRLYYKSRLKILAIRLGLMKFFQK